MSSTIHRKPEISHERSDRAHRCRASHGYRGMAPLWRQCRRGADHGGLAMAESRLNDSLNRRDELALVWQHLTTNLGGRSLHLFGLAEYRRLLPCIYGSRRECASVVFAEPIAERMLRPRPARTALRPIFTSRWVCREAGCPSLVRATPFQTVTSGSLSDTSACRFARTSGLVMAAS